MLHVILLLGVNVNEVAHLGAHLGHIIQQHGIMVFREAQAVEYTGLGAAQLHHLKNVLERSAHFDEFFRLITRLVAVREEDDGETRALFCRQYGLANVREAGAKVRLACHLLLLYILLVLGLVSSDKWSREVTVKHGVHFVEDVVLLVCSK